MIDLDKLLHDVNACTSWDDTPAGKLHLVVHDEIMRMGSFAHPADELIGMTLSQWQHEQAKRAIVAVLRFVQDAQLATMTGQTPVLVA